MDRTDGGNRTLVALDIETDGLDPRENNLITISVYMDDGEPNSFFFWDMRTPNYNEIGLLDQWFQDDKYTIVGHNLSFDLGWLKEKYGLEYPPGHRLWDTMLAEQLLTAGYDEQEVNLAATVERHFKVLLDKSLQTSFTMDSEITWEQIEYIKGDVEWLPMLVRQQAQKLSEYGMNDVWEVERHALPVFTEMVRVGIEIDLDRLNPLLEAAASKRDTLQALLQEQLTPLIEWKRIEQHDTMQAELDAWNDALEEERRQLRVDWYNMGGHTAEDAAGFNWELMAPDWVENKWNDWKINKKDGYPEGMRRYVKAQEKTWRENNPRPAKPKLDTDLINLDSGPQMMAAFEALGLPLPNFRSGTLSQKLLDANEEQLPLLKSLLEYKKAAKLLSAFGDRMIEKIGLDGRLRGNFKQIGTQTGRPTCSDPNMLQMPKDKAFRSCFIASDGYLLIVADYSQMELRIMAQLSKDPAMMQAFRDGVDLHTYTASLMFGIPLEKVDSDGKERRIAKTINFGIMYGMGPNKLRETLLAQGTPMTFPEAKRAVSQWKSTYKQAAAMIERMGMEAVSLGYTSTPFGRRRFFHLQFTEQWEKFAIMREGANHPIQGTNADITKLAMHLIQEKVKPIGGFVNLQIYDEIVTQVPEAFAPWGRDVVSSCMKIAAETVLTDVPAAVESMISRSWSSLDEWRG